MLRIFVDIIYVHKINPSPEQRVPLVKISNFLNPKIYRHIFKSWKESRNVNIWATHNDNYLYISLLLIQLFPVFCHLLTTKRFIYIKNETKKIHSVSEI